jgi:hypothetical protein
MSGQVGYEKQKIKNYGLNLNNSGVNVIIAITDYFKKSLRTVLFLRFYENWRWRQHLNCRRGRAAPFDPARGTVRLRYTG